MDFAPIIKEIGRGAKGAKPLGEDAAEALFAHLLDDEVPDMELGAILLCMRVKGEAADEISGFKRAMDARTARIEVPPGPRCVLLPTYNGARKQANLMPLVARLLAQRGVPVLIQGRHDFDSRVSPFELLAALGVEAAPSPGDAARELYEREEGNPAREPGEGCGVAENAALIEAMLEGQQAVPQPILDQVDALEQLARA